MKRKFVKWVNQFFILNHQVVDLYKVDIPEKKLNVIYDGVDLSEFEGLNGQTFCKEFNLSGEPLIGLVGRIIPGKGQMEFVQAAKEVIVDHPNAKFLLVGAPKGEDTKYFDDVKAYVKKENLEERIIFTGWRTDVKEIMAALDILVLASNNVPGRLAKFNY